MFKQWIQSVLFHINSIFISHQAFAAILLVLLTPTIVQILYSIPLVEAKVSSDAVLQFCGVMFGFVFAAMAYTRSRNDKDLRRLRELTPHLELSIRCFEGRASIVVANNSAHPIFDVQVGGSRPLFSIAPGSSRSVSYSYALLNEGNRAFLKKDVDHTDKLVIDIQFLDEDGNRWQTSFSALNQCRDGISFVLEQGALVGIGQ